MGNVHLKWAFSEAAVLFLRHTKDGKKLLARIEQKHGKGKALSILAASHGTELAEIAPHACATERPESSIMSHRSGSERV